MKNNTLKKYRAVLYALLTGVTGAAIWLALPYHSAAEVGLLPTPADPAQNNSEPGNALADATGSIRDAQNTETQKAPVRDNAIAHAAGGAQSPRKPLPGKDLAELMQRKLTPAMRREINQHLRPDNRAPRLRQGTAGTYVDLFDRASSVMIAIIDDNNNTVVADITQPIATD